MWAEPEMCFMCCLPCLMFSLPRTWVWMTSQLLNSTSRCRWVLSQLSPHVHSQGKYLLMVTVRRVISPWSQSGDLSPHVHSQESYLPMITVRSVISPWSQLGELSPHDHSQESYLHMDILRRVISQWSQSGVLSPHDHSQESYLPTITVTRVISPWSQSGELSPHGIENKYIVCVGCKGEFIIWKFISPLYGQYCHWCHWCHDEVYHNYSCEEVYYYQVKEVNMYWLQWSFLWYCRDVRIILLLRLLSTIKSQTC